MINDQKKNLFKENRNALSKLFVFVLFAFSPVGAQIVTPTCTFRPEEKNLLDQCSKWVDQNLKCKQFSQNNYRVPDFDKAPMGKCTQMGKEIFGHFDQNRSLGLVIEVDGGNWMGAHGLFIEDQEYVYCHFLKGNLSAKVFTERNQYCMLELLSFTNGPDLILVRDPKSTEESNASVFKEINGEMKEVLSYSYASVCHQCIGGYETRLIPEENGNLKLITLSIDNEVGFENENYFDLLKAHIFENVYAFNSSTGHYESNEPQKELPLVESAFNWFYDKDQTSYSGPPSEIFDNEKNLEEIISYLRLDKNDLRRKFALGVLRRNAGKDFGDSCDLWEKWKTERIKSASQDDSDK